MGAEQSACELVENSELPDTSEGEFGIFRILQLRNRRVPISETGSTSRAELDDLGAARHPAGATSRSTLGGALLGLLDKFFATFASTIDGKGAGNLSGPGGATAGGAAGGVGTDELCGGARTSHTTHLFPLLLVSVGSFDGLSNEVTPGRLGTLRFLNCILPQTCREDSQRARTSRHFAGVRSLLWQTVKWDGMVRRDVSGLTKVGNMMTQKRKILHRMHTHTLAS